MGSTARDKGWGRLPVVVGWLGVVAFGVPGVWAFGWPESFYRVAAPFPPFNLHLFHDVGAFQLGIAAGIMAGLLWKDALLAGLFGGSVGAVIHAVSHIIDADLGGNPADPYVLSGLAVLLMVATGVRHRRLRGRLRRR